MRINKTSMILHNVKSQHKIDFKGDSFLLRQMRLVYFLDWVSYYCAIYNNTNPSPVNLISKLKSLL